MSSELQVPPEPILPRNGVITIFGYGASISVDRGHLVLNDRVGPNRRHGRFPKIGHGIKRVVAIGSEGSVSLAALRWLSDQNASFVMLERDGAVLATTGPVSPSDVRLRRAQALAHQSDLALRVARELIAQKLYGQAHVIENHFQNPIGAESIREVRTKLSSAQSSDQIRLLESRGAHIYWSAWHKLPVTFPRNDLSRVPIHWQTFGSRMSPLTTSPRLAVNPANAMLNYLYAVLESEARLALASLGLDPGLGVLHNDLRSRDSLACDLMEPVRPQVDAYLLDWLNRGPLRRDWFFEQRDGNCRLMARLAEKLSQSAPIWRRAVAPFAEGIARSIWTANTNRRRPEILSTPLTQSRKRESRGSFLEVPQKPARVQANVCRICGTNIKGAYKYCGACATTIRRENVQKASILGRLATHNPRAQALRAKTQRRQMAARKAWKPSDQPVWLTEKFYREVIQPRLLQVQVRAIQSSLSVSEPYALRIRSRQCVPHPRHWIALARISDSGCI